MSPRSWWANCTLLPGDPEVVRIDLMEDAISPLSSDAKAIRALITSLELCHHKAERWVALIVEAIGKGETTKGPGTRPKGSTHPVEHIWRSCISVLSAWCNGNAIPGCLPCGSLSAEYLVAQLGEPSSIKRWQVQRVIDKLRSVVETGVTYRPLEENGNVTGDAMGYRRQTMEAIIRDSVDGKPAEISLAAAIDHLEPCHWAFTQNLSIVVGAIGGNLFPDCPFGACARNIRLAPIRPRMCAISNTLQVFLGNYDKKLDTDQTVLGILGVRNPQKQWLAASLDKTIRTQLGSLRTGIP